MVTDMAGALMTHRALARRAGSVLGLLVLIAALVVGSDAFGLRESLFGSATPPPRPSAFSRIASSTPANAQSTTLRSQPWWQTVQTLAGAGTTTTPAFRIDGDAIQWRVKYSCRFGRLLVRSSTAPAPLLTANCPAANAAAPVPKNDKSLSASLAVTADGPWRMVVEQQVDVPLDEQPLAAMSAPGAAAVISGRVYRIDESGMGRVTFYRLAGGRYALRLAGFYVSPNIDLELRLSPLPAPHSTHEYLAAPSVHVAPLDVTAGSLNFMLPRGVDPTRYGSLVVWCPLITSAYAAATLKPVQRPPVAGQPPTGG